MNDKMLQDNMLLFKHRRPSLANTNKHLVFESAFGQIYTDLEKEIEYVKFKYI